MKIVFVIGIGDWMPNCLIEHEAAQPWLISYYYLKREVFFPIENYATWKAETAENRNARESRRLAKLSKRRQVGARHKRLSNP